MGVWDKPLPVGVRSGNVWTSLDGDLQHRGASETGPGIWALISNQPGGLWDQARDETMILRPKGTDIWQAANDETMVLPRPQKNSVWQAAEDQTDKTEILGKRHIDQRQLQLRGRRYVYLQHPGAYGLANLCSSEPPVPWDRTGDI